MSETNARERADSREKLVERLADSLRKFRNTPMSDYDLADMLLDTVDLDALHGAGIEFAAGWQDIETAPKDGTEILLFGTERDWDWPDEPRTWLGSWSTTCWHGPAWTAFEHRGDTEYIVPTHWQPLPNPPLAALRIPVKENE